MDVINSNYYGQTSDIDRGFAQGIAVTSLAAAKQFPVSFPRRFMKTLKEMGKDLDLAIVPSDKGGGCVILDRVDYDSKVLNLLNCVDTYEPIGSQVWLDMSKEFNRKAKKIISNSVGGSQLKRLPECDPRCPFLRCTVKTHKDGFVMLT